mgnify:CR=1 FL=1
MDKNSGTNPKFNSLPLKSELILNRDGSVYHLHLHPEQLAPLVITVGDPGRVDLVGRYLDDQEFSSQYREFKTITGRLGSQRLTIISTGIGTDNVDIVLHELQLLHAYDLDLRVPKKTAAPLRIIRLGTSGALQADVPLDSLWMSDEALGWDGLLAFYQHDFPGIHLVEGLPKAYRVPGNAAMRNHFAEVVDGRGLTLTTAGFYAPQGRDLLVRPRRKDWLKQVSQWRDKADRITNMEMETAGIYGLGQLMGMPTLSISAILANRIQGSFSDRPEHTIERMITKTLERISALH